MKVSYYEKRRLLSRIGDAIKHCKLARASMPEESLGRPIRDVLNEDADKDFQRAIDEAKNALEKQLARAQALEELEPEVDSKLPGAT